MDRLRSSRSGPSTSDCLAGRIAFRCTRGCRGSANSRPRPCREEPGHRRSGVASAHEVGRGYGTRERSRIGDRGPSAGNSADVPRRRKGSCVTTWNNWAGTASSAPIEHVTPVDADEVRETILRALESGVGVKAIGASHSFTGIGATNGVRMHLTAMRGLIDADVASGRVTVWAGTHLWELPGMLDPLGLALPNMGDIDRQTITGASQTGTHGTGLRFGGFGTMIVAMTLVTGTGEILTITDEEQDLLEAAALGLGALGIVVTLTLQCVPRFLLRAVEAPAKLDDALSTWIETVETEDHFEFYWFPHTTTVRTKIN